jgi:hypothetical protein
MHRAYVLIAHPMFFLPWTPLIRKRWRNIEAPRRRPGLSAAAAAPDEETPQARGRSGSGGHKFPGRAPAGGSATVGFAAAAPGQVGRAAPCRSAVSVRPSCRPRSTRQATPRAARTRDPLAGLRRRWQASGNSRRLRAPPWSGKPRRPALHRGMGTRADPALHRGAGNRADLRSTVEWELAPTPRSTMERETAPTCAPPWIGEPRRLGAPPWIGNSRRPRAPPWSGKPRRPALHRGTRKGAGGRRPPSIS